MSINGFAEYHLRSAHKVLDEAEEKDPKLAERLAMSMMLNISGRWQEIMEKNEKQAKLKEIDNLN